MNNQQDILKNLKPKHDFFIGFDSDGCVFDTMEIKQKECFCPNTIKYWNLQPISRYAREVSEFVNLYSKTRGLNRFPALIKVFDLLAERKEVRNRGIKVPVAGSLRDWVASGTPLNNATLKEMVEKTGDPVLMKTLEWSNAVNRSIEEMVHGIPPFRLVRESLEVLTKKADLMCISQTPGEALAREWSEHDIAKYPFLIAGQELGTKKEHLGLGAVGKYRQNHILMVGDAPGDLEAAQENGVHFYPINPGKEEISWKRFYEEALDKFFNETYEGNYETNLIKEFQTYLPDTPPWQK